MSSSLGMWGSRCRRWDGRLVIALMDVALLDGRGPDGRGPAGVAGRAAFRIRCFGNLFDLAERRKVGATDITPPVLSLRCCGQVWGFLQCVGLIGDRLAAESRASGAACSTGSQPVIEGSIVGGVSFVVWEIVAACPSCRY
jgi:hypothetical protein